jgi:hypothetical protein
MGLRPVSEKLRRVRESGPLVWAEGVCAVNAWRDVLVLVYRLAGVGLLPFEVAALRYHLAGVRVAPHAVRVLRWLATNAPIPTVIMPCKASCQMCCHILSVPQYMIVD